MNTATYSLLDELEDAAQFGGTIPTSSSMARLGSLAHAIYFYRSKIGGLLSYGSVSAIEDKCYKGVLEFLSGHTPSTITNPQRSWGLASADESGRLIDQISQYALTAANRSPLPKASSHQVVSSLGEFHANIVEHSGRLSSSFVGFEVTDRFVGVYAGDLGQGPLASLRCNPTYSNLSDHGDALGLIIQDGVTSTGERGRGLGFRPIFEGLANRSGYLRFRAGDALLEISGIKRDELSLRKKQRPPIDGFHIYVHCEL